MPIVENMSSADYFAADGISKSGLDLIARSPAHYRYAPARQSTRAMEIGTALHMAILEPTRFAEHYVIVDCEDRRAAAYKQAAQAIGGHRVLTRAESDDLVGMQQAVWANPDAAALLTGAQTEVSFFATDPVTGVQVKARFDALSGLFALDLKKTQDARGSEFIRSVLNYRYHVQQAFYSDVFYWETGERLEDFLFLAVEQDMPHGVKPHRLPHDFVAYARKLYRADLNRYADCLMRDEWPGLDGSVETLQPTSWMLAIIENDADECGITYGEEE